MHKHEQNIICIVLRVLFALTIYSQDTSILASAYPLNTTCSPPNSQGGKGYCGPSFCDAITNTANTCIFTSKSYAYPTIISQIKSKTCIQSTDPRCTSKALAALMKGQGIKAAYCNDAFLVIHSDGTTGFTNYLTSIRNPPASISSDGTACVTRVTNPSYLSVKIPLYPTLLSTSDPSTNNVNTKSYPNGGGDGDGAYMSTVTPNTGATYGLPTRGIIINLIGTLKFQSVSRLTFPHIKYNAGAIGVTVGGEEIYPVFNNLAYLAPQKCEVDTCNQVKNYVQ